jgi:hypothetical protein
MLFTAFWSKEAFTEDVAEIRPLEFFSDDNGYEEADRQAISNLKVAQTWRSTSYGDYHIVTRVK